jgi:AraC-type DNA-binding domain-containing proteins
MILKKIVGNSLLTRLLLCFLFIILLFSIYQIISYRFFIKIIDNEISQYNISDLKTTSDKISSVLEQVKNSLLILGTENEFKHFNYTRVNNNDMLKCIKKIYNSKVDNPYIYDIFLFEDNYEYILTSTGSYGKDRFFQIFLSSEKYNAAFWKNLSNSNARSYFMPCSDFSSKELLKSESRYLMPVAVKLIDPSNLMLVALVDIRKVFDSIRQDSYLNTYLYYKGYLLYPDTVSFDVGNIPFDNSSGWYKDNNTYYFKQYSQNTDIVFVKTVNNKIMEKKSNEFGLFFVVIILLSVISTFLISFILAVKVNNPVKNIIEAINSSNANKRVKTSISELNFINSSIVNLVDKNTTFSKELNEKQSQLKAYFYQSRLKNIHTVYNDMIDYIVDKQHFLLFHFTIHFKKEFSVDILGNISKATFYLSEYIQAIIGARYKDTLSFQVEDNQIISIITFNEDTFDDALLDTLLEKIKAEKEYIYLTIVTSGIYNDISQLNPAYLEVINISKLQKVSCETQLLTSGVQSPGSGKFYFSDEQELSFSNHFINGNTNECIMLIQHALEINFNKDVRLLYFRRFSTHTLDICIKLYNNLELSIPESINFNDIYSFVDRCYTLEDFKNLFYSIISELTAPIADCKNETDYIKDYVTEYINNHFSEDIYLDLLSDKLNITSSYLSHYFKIKTGVNFSDYLNNVRLNKAKELLADTDEKELSISRNVGYVNINTFIRVFKKYIGLTPGEYRKKVRSESM